MKLFNRVRRFFRSKKPDENSFEYQRLVLEEVKILQPTYDINGNRDLLIVNIAKFDNQDGRSGSEVDVESLKSSFGTKSFKLFKDPLNGRVTYNDFHNLLKAYIKHIQKKGTPKLLAIAIMSHGTENDKILFSDHGTKSVYKILKPIFTCDELTGVPKLVICQFCRGEFLIPTATMVADSANDNQTTINGQADTLFYFATAIGNLAIRDDRNGSPFIKVFCEIFCKEKNVWEMSIAINRKIAEKDFRINYDGDISKYKQIPFFCHSFTKMLIF